MSSDWYYSDVVGVKQVSPALPAFDFSTTMGNIVTKGKADEALALPLPAQK